jgi:serine/threonine-protein kinase
MITEGTMLDDRYRIVRLLGEGAMGAVYEAVHEVIGRRVALKLLHAKYTRNADAVSRFTREARAAASIGHPNIVAVTDFGTHGVQPFMVMDLLRGETLGDRIARVNTMSVDKACLVAGQVLSALHAAHAIGVVHRDVKPDNVFVCDDRTLAVKLLDFGVSKFHATGVRLEQITRDGLAIGTPHYMSPEQWNGLRDVDHRADLYAVGVLLYELLTGVVPFDAPSEALLFKAVVHGDVAAPPGTMTEGIPPALDEIIMRAIARDRDQRFGTAEEFLDALRPFGARAALFTTARTEALSQLPRSSARPPRAKAVTLRDEAPMITPSPTPRALAVGTAALAVVSLLAWRVVRTHHDQPRTPAAMVAETRSLVVDAGAVMQPRGATQTQEPPTMAATSVDGTESPSAANAPPDPETSPAHSHAHTTRRHRHRGGRGMRMSRQF